MLSIYYYNVKLTFINVSFERDNLPIVKRYVESLTEERNRLLARHDELREIEKRLDHEVKQVNAMVQRDYYSITTPKPN